MKHKYQRIFFSLLIAIFFFIGCTGCDSSNTDKSALQEDGPKLKITVSANSDTATSIFPPEELGNNLTYKMLYWHVENVNISINGSLLPLEDALSKNLITFPEIMEYAQVDARNGMCSESFTSSHGLTHFTYKYPDYDLRIINDIYATPDGEEHLIRTLSIFPSGGAIGPYVDFYSQETGDRLDREDWGITLEAVDVAPTGITVKCTQSGGQQIGQLYTSWYALRDSDGFVENIYHPGEAPSYEFAINMEATSTFHIDWSNEYGELPSGTYKVLLYIEDRFDPSQVHPLMDDFHDMQRYGIVFTIP